ncbi:hypothetical protein COI_1669 [Mannheimia haemolytica serotype A2 str. OVINE]|nr:hypothetical protein COI_1669 [Mannheimia haemolytica serotype A2 str. OVINE]
MKNKQKNSKNSDKIKPEYNLIVFTTISVFLYYICCNLHHLEQFCMILLVIMSN